MAKKGKSASPSAISTFRNIDGLVNYVLIISLILLLAYAFIYIMNITKASREAFSNSDAFKVMYVYSNSCGYCRAFHPTFDRFATEIVKEYPHVDVKRMEISELDPKFADSLNISAFPTTVIFDQSQKEINRIVGKRDFLPLMREVTTSFKLNTTTSESH